MINSSQRPLPDNTQHSQQTNIHAPVGFEPTISAGERPQTYALDRAATGTCPAIIRLYSVLLAIWMSRPNTALPQHQGATEETYYESHDVKEIAPVIGPSDPPTHQVQKAPCPAIKWWDPDHSLSSKAERCYTCTAHTQIQHYFTLLLLT